MAKKLNNNIYENQNEEPEGRRILIDPKEQPENNLEPKEPREKRSKWVIFRPVVITLISLALVAGSIFYGYNYLKTTYFAPVEQGNNTPIQVTIPQAASLTTIAQILYDHKVIRDKNVFKLYTDFSDVSYKLKTGTYELSKNMSFDDIIYTLIKGQAAPSVTEVTLTEGMNIQTMGTTMVNKGVLTDDTKFLSLAKDGSTFTQYPFIADVLKNSADRKFALEGYLFPDTYQFFTNSAENVIIQKQLDRFDQIFTDDYIAQADKMNMTIDQVVTLASIIEKEGKPQDFAKISAVFHNRLDAKMPLQSDATLQYALGVKKYVFNDTELATKSPYNTYVVKSLPLGPICNPGKNAIEAALYPDQDYVDQKYLYFSLTDPNSGELVFSKTLKDHLAVVAQYQPSWVAADNAAASASASPSAKASATK